jgi:dTDP-glucose pyrophosphorylase
MYKEKLNSLLIPVYTTVKQAMQKLDETAEKILFVVDDKKRLLATLTDGDIRRAIIRGSGFTDSIDTVMNQKYVFLRWKPTPLVEEAKELMVVKEIEQLPILDEEGAIVDVILWTDVLDRKPLMTPVQSYMNYVVIMAGGKGTRMDPFTRIFPKPLIPIEEKPIIEVIMDRFYKSGFQKFILTLNYKKEYIKIFLRESNMPYSVEWVEEPVFMGTAGSLSLLRDKLQETFIVANCDSLLDINVGEVLDWHKKQNAAMTVIGCYNEVKIHFGVLELGDGKLKRILEKPTHDVIINTGIYVMEPNVINYIDNGKEENMDRLIGKLIEADEKVTVYPIHSGWLDIGRWDQYKQALRDYEF